jgi:hypothetical protein
MGNQFKTILYLVATALPLLYIAYTYSMLDIWNDEMYTLRYFTFTYWSTTLADYHVPNNHIFYNVINKVYLTILGMNSLEDVIQYPWILRIPLLLMGLLTLYLVFRIAELQFDRNAAWISVALLISTLPWQNHYLQIRGYGLSTLLFTATIYYSLLLLNKFNRKSAIGLFFSTAFLFYTIPLNMYYILPVIIFMGVYSILYIVFQYSGQKLTIVSMDWIQSPAFKVAFISGLGVLLGLALYGPVLNVLFDNDTVKTKAFPPLEFLPILDLLMSAFLNKRYLIIPLSIFGGILYLFHFKSFTVKINLTSFYLVFLLVSPIAIAVLREDPAPDRSFIMITPVFALVLGCMASIVLRFVAEKYVPYFILMIMLYIGGIGYRETQLMHEMLYHDIIHNSSTQNISRAYYLSHFESHSGVRKFMQIQQQRPAPLYIYAADHHGIRGYLDAYKIPWYDETAIDSLYASGNSFYILNTSPLHISKKLSEKYPLLLCVNILPEYDFHNYCYCKHQVIEIIPQ